MGLERRIATFSGDVQGVGFRYTTRQVAEEFAVAGYVRNLTDGTVEVLAEGDSEEIDRFLEMLSRYMKAHISEVAQQTTGHRGEHTGFSVSF